MVTALQKQIKGEEVKLFSLVYLLICISNDKFKRGRLYLQPTGENNPNWKTKFSRTDKNLWDIHQIKLLPSKYKENKLLLRHVGQSLKHALKKRQLGA